jgi:hypothetical protein
VICQQEILVGIGHDSLLADPASLERIAQSDICLVVMKKEATAVRKRDICRMLKPADAKRPFDVGLAEGQVWI